MRSKTKQRIPRKGSSLWKKRDIYIWYDFEDVFFRWSAERREFYRRFGDQQREEPVAKDNRLLNEALRSGVRVDSATYLGGTKGNVLDERKYDPVNAISDAYALAMRVHRGQTDKVGEPYVHHVIRVASAVRDLGSVYEICAVLHDVVEDSDIEISDIHLQFGSEVAEAVEALTKRPDESYLEEYLTRVMANRIAREVKLADSKDNLSRIDRIMDEETRVRLLNKYQVVLRKLGGEQPYDYRRFCTDIRERANKKIENSYTADFARMLSDYIEQTGGAEGVRDKDDRVSSELGVSWRTFAYLIHVGMSYE